MQKQAPSFGRILTMVLFALSCFGLLLFLWISFGGAIPLKPKGYQFKIAFPEATQLGLEADVRVAGVRVGKVRGKELDPHGNRTLATIELDPKFAPVRKNAKAILRQKTLLGETYVELTPGTPGSPTIPEGGTLSNARVTPTVELDEIFTVFDPQTREAFKAWQQDLDASYTGHGQDLSDSFGNLPTFATDATALLKIFDEEGAPLQRLVRDTGGVFSALTQDEGALHGLIVNSGAVFSATASQNEALAETFRIFPTFLDESRLTLARLRTFAVDTRPLIRDLRPVARDLKPTLHDVRLLAPDLRRLFRDLGPLIDASKKGLPALRDTLRGTKPVLAATAPFLRQPQPDPRLPRNVLAPGQRLPRVRGRRSRRQGPHGHPRRRRPLPAPDQPERGRDVGRPPHAPGHQPRQHVSPAARLVLAADRGERHVPELGLQEHGRGAPEASVRAPARGLAGLHRGQADLLPGQDAGRLRPRRWRDVRRALVER